MPDSARADATEPRVVMLLLNPYLNDTRVEKEAATLRESGYAVTVVALAAPGAAAREERDGISVRRVERPAGPRFARFRRLQGALRDAVRAEEPDVVHCHDSEALAAGAGTARSLGVPFVYDAHDLWLGRLRRGRSWLYWRAYLAYYGFVERRLLPLAAAAITVSPPIAAHLERQYGLARVELVPNYPKLEAQARSTDLRTLPGLAEIPGAAPIVLYLGNVMSGRGVEQLISAMGSVPDAHLVLLGGGGQRELVQAVAERAGVRDRVHAVDPVPSERVVEYAASASVGVSPILPSCLNYRYSLPNKLFQYMAAGLPVVASNFDQVREVVEGNGAGVTVDPADPAAIGSAIRAVLASEEERREMGSRARLAVEDRYNWAVAERTLRDVYRRVAPLRR